MVEIDNEHYQDVIVQDWDEGDHGDNGYGYQDGYYDGYYSEGRHESRGRSSSAVADPSYDPLYAEDGHNGAEGGYNYGSSSEFETHAGGGYSGPDADVNTEVTRYVDDSGQV